MAAVDRKPRRLPVDGAFRPRFTVIMLMQADLPDDIDALRALVPSPHNGIRRTRRFILVRQRYWTILPKARWLLGDRG